MTVSTSADLILGGSRNGFTFYPESTDPVLIKYKDDIKDFAYSSYSLPVYYDRTSATGSAVEFCDRANLSCKE